MTTLADVGYTTWRVADEVEYDPYGNPRRAKLGDFNRSGGFGSSDINDFLAAFFSGSPAADTNNNGLVSTQDLYDFLSEYFTADSTPPDRISGLGPVYQNSSATTFALIDNPYGYCGYYFDQETAAAKVLGPGGGALYQCRFRVYDPIAGRWLQQDPAGFIDGSNLYEYCGGDSVGCFDPAGLATQSFTVCQEEDHGRQRSVRGTQRGRTLPQWLEDFAYYQYSAAVNVGETISNIVHALTHPVQTAEGMWQQAKQQEANHAARQGREATYSGAVFEFAASLVGANDIASAVFGYSSAEDRMLEGTERVAAGFRGVGTMILTGVGGAQAAGVGRAAKVAEEVALVQKTEATVATTTRTNAQLVQDIAKRAESWGGRKGLGQGHVAGTLKHGYADRLLTRYQRMYGSRGLSTEVRYLHGAEWQSGMPVKGSVRLDVVEGPRASPSAVYDYKFGSATLTPSRITELRTGAGLGPSVPVIGVHP